MTDKKTGNGKVIKVCHGRHCGAVGKFILERLEAEMGKNPAKKTKVEPCACRGLCSEGPIVVEEIGEKTIIHKKMDPIKAAKIL